VLYTKENKGQSVDMPILPSSQMKPKVVSNTPFGRSVARTMRRLPARFDQAVSEFVEDNKFRSFLWAPVFFGMGVLVYFSLKFEPSLWSGLTGCGALGWLAFKIRRMDHAFAGYAYLAVMAVFMAAMGFSVATLRTMQLHTPLVTKQMGPVMLQGRIKNVSRVDEKAAMVLLEDVMIERLDPAMTPHAVRLRSYHMHPDFVPGAQIEILAKLTPPSRPVLPQGYDFQRKAYFDGIGAVGFTLGQERLIEATPEQTQGLSNGVSRFFETVRHKVNQRIETVQDPLAASVSKALVTGDRAAIPEDQMEVIRGSGLAHLLAISGLHIGLVSGFVFFVSRFMMALWPFLALNYPIKKYAAFLALLSAVFYMFMAGATIPTQRATLMTGVVLLAVMLDRRALSLRLVAIAALAVIAYRPDSVLNPSFQLSFAAVVALIAFYEWYVRRKRDNGRMEAASPVLKPLYYLGGIILTSIIATLATSLFSVYHFGRFNAYGLLGNVAAMPVMSLVVMPAAIMALVFAPFEGLSALCFRVMEYGVDVILTAAQTVGTLPHATLHIAQIPDAAMLCFSMAFLVCCLVRGVRVKALLTLLCTVCGGFFWVTAPSLVMLVHDDPLTISYRSVDGALRHEPRVPPRFVKEQVQEFYGLTGDEQSAEPRAKDDASCDAFGCFLTLQGARNERVIRVEYLFDPLLFDEACARQQADFIIVARPVPWERKKACRGNNVRSYDFFDFWREGTHALIVDFWSGKGSMVSVEDLRGKRPWTTPNQRKAFKDFSNRSETL